LSGIAILILGYLITRGIQDC